MIIFFMVLVGKSKFGMVAKWIVHRQIWNRPSTTNSFSSIQSRHLDFQIWRCTIHFATMPNLDLPTKTIKNVIIHRSYAILLERLR